MKAFKSEIPHFKVKLFIWTVLHWRVNEKILCGHREYALCILYWRLALVQSNKYIVQNIQTNCQLCFYVWQLWVKIICIKCFIRQIFDFLPIQLQMDLLIAFTYRFLHHQHTPLLSLNSKMVSLCCKLISYTNSLWISLCTQPYKYMYNSVFSSWKIRYSRYLCLSSH